MRQIFTRLALTGAGTILGLIGGALMFSPKTFLAMSHVIVERDPSLMSELAAPSGLLLISGALMIFGAIKFQYASLALFIGALVYGSYGAGRLVSISLHGLPSESLITAMVIELAVAILLSALGVVNQVGQNSTNADAYIAQMSV